MRRKVVRTFVVVFIADFAAWRQPLEKTLEIPAYGRIGIFIQGQ